MIKIAPLSIHFASFGVLNVLNAQRERVQVSQMIGTIEKKKTNAPPESKRGPLAVPGVETGYR
jgi:hypothetical protein